MLYIIRYSYLHRNTCEFAHAHCLAAKEGALLRIMPEEHCEKQPQPQHVTTTTMPKRAQIVTRREDAESKAESEACKRKWAQCKAKAGEQDDDPYCGTDFNTYRNFCELQVRKSIY